MREKERHRERERERERENERWVEGEINVPKCCDEYTCRKSLL